VLDDNFDFERLCRVAGLEENEGLEALEELLKRGLVREQRQATARPYVLAHDRFREGVYYQASEPRRRIFHRRAFEVLEAIAAPPAELARHALAAGLLERAFDLNVSAGNEALRLYAPQVAIKHFTYALETARQLAISPPPSLYHARGRAYETVGAFGQARDDFQQVLKKARAGADQPGEWRALQDLGFLWASRDYEQAGASRRRDSSWALRVTNCWSTLFCVSTTESASLSPSRGWVSAFSTSRSWPRTRSTSRASGASVVRGGTSLGESCALRPGSRATAADALCGMGRAIWVAPGATTGGMDVMFGADGRAAADGSVLATSWNGSIASTSALASVRRRRRTESVGVV
jgi:tetratricopeptide (TPR) repeat protein